MLLYIISMTCFHFYLGVNDLTSLPMEMGRFFFLSGLETLNVGELIVIILSLKKFHKKNNCFIA